MVREEVEAIIRATVSDDAVVASIMDAVDEYAGEEYFKGAAMQSYYDSTAPGE